MPRRAATAQRRNPFRRWAVLCALVAATGVTHPASGAAPAARTVVADLKGVTTITWSGMAAIRLRVPRDVQVPESAYRFTQRRGRYVSVRAFENPQPIGCKRDLKQDWCAGIWLDWLADLAETTGHGTNVGDPSRDFFAALNDPPVVRRGGWDLYLFTDKTATIEIRAAGLGGRASYVAGGTFAGRAVNAPGACRLAPCATSPAHADRRMGGAAFDVGKAGFVQAMAYGAIHGRDVAPGAGSQQPFLLRSCQYPSREAPDASADPARHPDGCDTVPPSSARDTAFGNVNELGSAGPATFRAIYGAGSAQVSGRVYLGFRATSAGSEAPRLGGLLIWLRYGIR